MCEMVTCKSKMVAFGKVKMGGWELESIVYSMF